MVDVEEGEEDLAEGVKDVEEGWLIWRGSGGCGRENGR
jgi:hypothetical protein